MECVQHAETIKDKIEYFNRDLTHRKFMFKHSHNARSGQVVANKSSHNLSLNFFIERVRIYFTGDLISFFVGEAGFFIGVDLVEIFNLGRALLITFFFTTFGAGAAFLTVFFLGDGGAFIRFFTINGIFFHRSENS